MIFSNIYAEKYHENSNGLSSTNANHFSVQTENIETLSEQALNINLMSSGSCDFYVDVVNT